MTVFLTPEEAIAYIRGEGIKFIDVKFCDLSGIMWYFPISVDAFKDDASTKGLMFDDSSIRGFQAIYESDTKLVPDMTSVYVSPFRIGETLVVNFSIVDPFTGELYFRDPRNIVRRAEEYLHSTGITDTVYFGAEAELYVFDDIRFDSQVNSPFHAIDSGAGRWNAGRDEAGVNLGYRMRLKGGYLPVSPNGHFCDLQGAMSVRPVDVGLEVERAHHEIGTGGQQGVNYIFNTLLVTADNLIKFKYIIKNTAFEHDESTTFMPKPLFGSNDSSIYCRQSLWKNDVPLFANERGYGGPSDVAHWYIGRLLEHAPSLLASTNPSINSLHRLVSSFEAPVNLVYSTRDRSACIRISVTGSSAKTKRAEYRVSDSSANPHLAFAA